MQKYVGIRGKNPYLYVVGLFGGYLAQRLACQTFPLSFPHVKFKVSC